MERNKKNTYKVMTDEEFYNFLNGNNFLDNNVEEEILNDYKLDRIISLRSDAISLAIEMCGFAGTEKVIETAKQFEDYILENIDL